MYLSILIFVFFFFFFFNCLTSFFLFFFFFASRRRHTRYIGDWSSDVWSSDLGWRRAWIARSGLPRRSAPKTRPCNPCPTPARPNGTVHTRRGSSKRSSSRRSRPATTCSTPRDRKSVVSGRRKERTDGWSHAQR